MHKYTKAQKRSEKKKYNIYFSNVIFSLAVTIFKYTDYTMFAMDEKKRKLLGERYRRLPTRLGSRNGETPTNALTQTCTIY